MKDIDKDEAEEYVDTLLNKDDAELDKFLDEYIGDLKLNKKQAGAILGIIKGVGICSYLAGLEAGRPKWHKVADGDLPKNQNRVWLYFGNDDYNDGQFIRGRFWCNSCGWFDVEEVIAWKEMILPELKESE